MVHIYGMNITELPDPKEHPEVLNGLPKERQEKTLRCQLPEGRKQSLGAGLLQKEVFCRHGISMESIREGENGKPQAEGICFNLSHSGEFAICAVGEKPVGCDVEKVSEARMKVAEHFFCQSEIQYLKKFEKEDQNREFIRLWTMKESYIKMTGEGMRLPFDQFEAALWEEKIVIRRNGQKVDCCVKEYDVPGYKVSVCAEEGQFAPEVEWVDGRIT